MLVQAIVVVLVGTTSLALTWLLVRIILLVGVLRQRARGVYAPKGGDQDHDAWGSHEGGR